ncbi:MAG TPA: ATP-binding protein [Herpetosiphonaceae bacterium]
MIDPVWHALIVERTSDLICLLDEEGRYVYLSPSYKAVLGFEPTALLGVSCFSLLHPADAEQVGAQWAKVVAQGQGRAVYRYQHADGSWRWIETNASITDYQGQQYAIGVSRDITERKRAEDGLEFLALAGSRLSQSLDEPAVLRELADLAVAELADVCLAYLADEGRAAISDLVGAHADPAQASVVRLFQHGYRPDFANPGSIVIRVIKTGESELYPAIERRHYETVAFDEESLALFEQLDPFSGMVVPIQAGDAALGAIVLLTSRSQRQYDPIDLALAEDLGRRAGAAIENARLYRAARDAARVRDQFISVAAHELKNPLTTLLGMTQILKRRVEREATLGERDQRALGQINHQAQRLNKLISGLLDLSRLEDGQLSIERAPVDLAALLARVVEETAAGLTRHTIAFEPPARAPIIAGDELRLEQVFHNILQNAVKYSPDGGEISVELASDSQRAAVTISDQGEGIPAEALPHIFARFYRADNARSYPGMGVGLSVVKEIVSLHGGTVEAASEPGGGAVFTLLLPLAG